MSKIYAVITGDVISSGDLDFDYKDRLKQTFDNFEEIHKEHLHLPVDHYAGDQFQFLLETPEKALECTLFIYSHLASIQPQIFTRLSIVIGEIESLPEEEVSTADGPAFRLSGTAIEDLESHQRIKFSLLDNKEKIMSVFQGAFDLLSLPLSNLTTAQAEYIFFKLQDYSDKEIQDELGIKQQSVHDRKSASNWINIEPFINSFEKYYEN